MIEADEKDFLELLGDLFGAHTRNLKADIAGGYWKGLKHMTLGEFRRVIEHDLEQLQHAPSGVARPPTVAEIWEIHRTLRRKATEATSSSSEPKYTGDGWSVNGNLLLTAHIMRSSKPPELDYAPDSVLNAQGKSTQGPHTEAIAKILTRWMNAWVEDMRGGSEPDGRGHWQFCMGEADREVREYLARYVRQQVAA